MMEARIIDTKGFNFHCPEDRSYVIFDPQNQEEYEDAQEQEHNRAVLRNSSGRSYRREWLAVPRS